MNWSDLVSRVITIAEGAGAETMRFYKTDDLKVDAKSDDSPVSAADLAAHHYIVDRLEGLLDDAEVISEESAEARGFAPPTGTQFWLVDPLDGTKEFINQRDEFTVNIALIENGRPVMGVVVAPALGLTWAGSPEGAFHRRGQPQSHCAARRPRGGTDGHCQPFTRRSRGAGGVA